MELKKRTVFNDLKKTEAIGANLTIFSYICITIDSSDYDEIQKN